MRQSKILGILYKWPGSYLSGSGMLFILFLTYSKQEKNIVFMAQERAMETPRPDDDK